MSKHLPVPPDLEHLIEKRDRESDRREQTRRNELEPQESGDATAGTPERRQKTERRRKRRRKADS